MSCLDGQVAAAVAALLLERLVACLGWRQIPLKAHLSCSWHRRVLYLCRQFLLCVAITSYTACFPNGAQQLTLGGPFTTPPF